MKKSYQFIVALGILFLFFVQMAGILVESIYIEAYQLIASVYTNA